ncbi:MAG TPA: hypothetical protein VFT56_04370 [Sphingomonas sp.]|jgi:hypothetical protein|nr:hypothetical protein [Sphingomonas sp.]
MKIIALLALVTLSTGCHRSPTEKRADRQAADAQADVLDNYSNLLDVRAKQKQENQQQASDMEETAEDNIAVSQP